MTHVNPTDRHLKPIVGHRQYKPPVPGDAAIGVDERNTIYVARQAAPVWPPHDNTVEAAEFGRGVESEACWVPECGKPASHRSLVSGRLYCGECADKASINVEPIDSLPLASADANEVGRG